MFNEVLYCERLLYLEWAQGEFDDNVFTVDGRSVHRRADIVQISTQVLIIDIGPADGRGRSAIASLGRAYLPPERMAIVI